MGVGHTGAPYRGTYTPKCALPSSLTRTIIQCKIYTYSKLVDVEVTMFDYNVAVREIDDAKFETFEIMGDIWADFFNCHLVGFLARHFRLEFPRINSRQNSPHKFTPPITYHV